MPELNDTAINHDAVDNDGFDAFLSNLSGEAPRKREERSTKTDDEAHDGGAAETADDVEDTGNGEDEQTEGTEQEPDPDDVEVEVKVGEETKKATIKELKRLYGQEASLTQKSQALAAQRQAADAKFTSADTALKSMLTRATEAFKPYADLDMLVLSQRMDTETFQALRADAAAAEANVKFFETELQGITQAHQRDAQAAYKTAAEDCIKALEHPDTGIKGWSPQVYSDLMTWADTQGAPQARSMVSPSAIKIIHMAMQWDKAEKARLTAEKKIEAAPNRPTKVLRPGPGKAPAGQSRTAMQQLRKTGSVDDATDAFLASFK